MDRPCFLGYCEYKYCSYHLWTNENISARLLRILPNSEWTCKKYEEEVKKEFLLSINIDVILMEKIQDKPRKQKIAYLAQVLLQNAPLVPKTKVYQYGWSGRPLYYCVKCLTN